MCNKSSNIITGGDAPPERGAKTACAKAHAAATPLKLDTLAQGEPAGKSTTETKTTIPTEISRSFNKALSRATAKRLYEACPDSPLRSSYRNTIYCTNTFNLYEADGVLKKQIKYCKNRWCVSCNRIRTGLLINKYFDEIKSWKNKQSVTLTLQNCFKDELECTITEIQSIIRRFCRNLRKRNNRNGNDKAKIIAKLECTHNNDLMLAKEPDYHPHFHVFCDSRETADELREFWFKEVNKKEGRGMKLNGKPCKRAEFWLQKIDRVTNTVESVKELFKYYSKISSGTTKKDAKGKKTKKPLIFVPEAQDVIFCAMKGKQVFQTYGFSGKTEDETQKEYENYINPNAQEIAAAQEQDDADFGTLRVSEADSEKLGLWQWSNTLYTWVNVNTGELYAMYALSEPMQRTLDIIQGESAL